MIVVQLGVNDVLYMIVRYGIDSGLLGGLP